MSELEFEGVEVVVLTDEEIERKLIDFEERIEALEVLVNDLVTFLRGVVFVQ